MFRVQPGGPLPGAPISTDDDFAYTYSILDNSISITQTASLAATPCSDFGYSSHSSENLANVIRSYG